MHALEEVRGQCWASPSITLLCFILRKSLGESLDWFQQGLGICLFPHIPLALGLQT